MTDDYLGLLLAESCILFLNWYQKELRPIATAWAIELPGNTDPEEEPPIFLPKERHRTLDIGERDLPGSEKHCSIYRSQFANYIRIPAIPIYPLAGVFAHLYDEMLKICALMQ